ncbi:phospholipid scramblase-like [Eupeodes corollae]|uniref:phospholipid scramblase-like n=1 Tax=Eupeodes corollae TaxID=290404 RepID=UPI002491EC5F|nr:phospholipid scramblase-like [Eupeodes corollae]
MNKFIILMIGVVLLMDITLTTGDDNLPRKNFNNKPAVSHFADANMPGMNMPGMNMPGMNVPGMNMPSMNIPIPSIPSMAEFNVSFGMNGGPKMAIGG